MILSSHRIFDDGFRLPLPRFTLHTLHTSERFFSRLLSTDNCTPEMYGFLSCLLSFCHFSLSLLLFLNTQIYILVATITLFLISFSEQNSNDSNSHVSLLANVEHCEQKEQCIENGAKMIRIRVVETTPWFVKWWSVNKWHNNIDHTTFCVCGLHTVDDVSVFVTHLIGNSLMINRNRKHVQHLHMNLPSHTQLHTQ